MKLEALYVSLGLSTFTGELITFAVAILIISTVFWLLVGRFRLYNMLINIYISLALLQVLPSVVPDMGKYTAIMVFVIAIIILFLMEKYLFDIHISGSGMPYWEVFIISFLEVGLLTSIVFTYVPQKEIIKYISVDSLQYFISPWARLAWMVIPLVFVIIVNKRGK